MWRPITDLPSRGSACARGSGRPVAVRGVGQAAKPRQWASCGSVTPMRRLAPREGRPREGRRPATPMLAGMTDAGGPVADFMLESLRRVPGGIWRTYIAPDVKVIYESLNKNACTSLKWMMADLAGEDLSTFRAGWQPFVNASEAVHNRELWKMSPKLNQLTEEQRADIHPDNGWFVFAVVRDPRVRLFSAWQNKLLIETPNSQRWKDELWYPRHPLSFESVVKDFAAFVELLETEPDHWLRTNDPHFRDQVELLVEDAVPYTRIYDIGEMHQLTTDLRAHLEVQGHQGQLYLPRANPTPLRAIGALYTNGVRERIERVYAADFERFGHLWDFSRVETAETWSSESLAACESEAALGLRIAEVHRMAREQRAKARRVAERLEELEAVLSQPHVRLAAQGGEWLRQRTGRLRGR